MPPLFRIEHLKQYVIYSDTKIYKQNKKMVTFWDCLIYYDERQYYIHIWNPILNILFEQQPNMCGHIERVYTKNI